MSSYPDQVRLYARARELVEQPTKNRELADTIDEGVEDLVARLVADFQDRVLAAASSGSTKLDLLRFHGSDLDEGSGYAILTLVKGPRDPVLRHLVGPPALPKLRRLLAPFSVTHVWHTRSNLNRLVVSWEEDLVSDTDTDSDSDASSISSSNSASASNSSDEEGGSSDDTTTINRH